jgi:hypothetical protein
VDTEEFSARMESIADLDSAGKSDACLQESRRLKWELVASNGSPEQQGWSIYYEFKSLFQLERFTEGLALMEGEFHQTEIGLKNSGWMCSVAGEMAARLKRIDTVVEYGRLCLSYRRAINDPVSEIQCAQTFCRLLEWGGDSSQNLEFAQHEIVIGLKHKALVPVADGIHHLLENFKATKDESLKKLVLDYLAEACAIEDDEHQSKLHEVILAANDVMDLEFQIPPKKPQRAEALTEGELFSLCQVGDSGDELLKSGLFREAISRYSDCVRQMEQLKCIDSFIMAKVTLGTLIALIRDHAVGNAFEVWTATPETSLYGIGISAIEGAQTSESDLITYLMISAYLQSVSSQPPEISKGSIDSLLGRCLEYAKKKQPDTIPLIIHNWHLHYTEILDGNIPADWLASYTQSAEEFGIQLGTAKTVLFPTPSKWEITWKTSKPFLVSSKDQAS